MKVLRGLAEVRGFVVQRRRAAADAVPEEVSQRIQAIFGRSLSPSEVVAHVLAEVKSKGDAAVRELTQRIDGVQIDKLEVDRAAINEAAKGIAEDLREALEAAAARIGAFARASLPKTWQDGATGLGEMVVPMERVGVYAPGGTAAYPSTVLMTVIVARAAGVKEVVLCTPARDGVNPSPAVLAAAQIAGVDRVFRIGGAQAIAAMAYGTKSVPAVDKVCGPGNIFVALAKQQVFGQVGIDGIFGPTETVVVADAQADPKFCAADLLAQAEHDLMATPILITTSEELARRVETEMAAQLQGLERRDIARAALDNQGAIVIAKDLDEAMEVANLFAPEHLNLLVRRPQALLGKVRHAGAVFVGEYSCEVLGDYVAGPSHTLPTQGSARFSSYLGVQQFVRHIPVVALDVPTAKKLAPAASLIARAEGFTAHARAAELRLGPARRRRGNA